MGPDLHSTPDFRRGDDDAERAQLERLAPSLFAIQGDEPFNVPEHFFDRLPHEVQAKVLDQERKTLAFGWLWRIAIAAPVAAVLFGAWWFTRSTPATNDPAAITSDAETIPAISDLEGLEEDDLLFAVALDNDRSPEAADPELTDEELLDYLDQNADLNELISEL
ncbi:MAG: hypothetical protein ABI599_05920 [Flavobacteriales bacterium]